MIQILYNIDLIMNIIEIYFIICFFSMMSVWLLTASYINVPKKLDKLLKLLFYNTIGSFILGILYIIFCCVYVV